MAWVVMANFDLFLPRLLSLEGGYVNDPDDPGGETNKGITMTTFAACSRELLGLEPTSASLKTLTNAQAGIIYRNLYWNKISADQFPSQDLAEMVCDFYINAGAKATLLLQQILSAMGQRVVQDGIFGPICLEALAKLPSDEVYRRYKQGRKDYYLGLGHEYPEFLAGWLNRVNTFPDV